ncbi:hypothetical protein [Nocardia brasiliensis]|uniref:hypothetical protein n=1 Tax=Nocardia brasiliensis TaxID=37326 RepID=UPI002455CE86|nr:hypothetical protein [Nocardia brasiliensis]
MKYHVLNRELLMPMLRRLGINSASQLAERSNLDLSTVRRSFTGTPSSHLLIFLSTTLRIDLRKVLTEKEKIHGGERCAKATGLRAAAPYSGFHDKRQGALANID